MSADPVTAMTAFGIASKLPGMVSSTLSSLKTAREMAKEYKETDLKDKLSDVYDSVLDLREALHELQSENESLRKQLTQKASVKRDGRYGYYFADGDPDPLCPKCYETEAKLVHLDPAHQHYESTQMTRSCTVCDFRRIEVRATPAGTARWSGQRD